MVLYLMWIPWFYDDDKGNIEFNLLVLNIE